MQLTDKKPLTILGHPHAADGSGFYRYYQPFKHLARGSDHRILLPEPGTKFVPEDDQLEEIDMISGQRFCGNDGLMLWEHWKDKVLLVCETDDDVLNPDTWSGLAHWFDPKVLDTFRKVVTIADLVTVSTEPLAEQMRQYNENVIVVPNHIDGDLLYHDRPRRDRLTVGWAGGMSHMMDWEIVADATRSVFDKHPDVDMHFVGIDYSPLLHRTCRYTPWKLDTWEYFKSIDFDIGVAPLAATTFNDSKSHIKALEYMALGIPVLASDRPAYRDLVVDGVTGFLASSEDEWRTRLTELINDEAMRAEMGAKGREVAAGWTIQQGWKKWRDAFEGVAGWQA
ncbi:MAG TPA: glycosyltransferase [Jiangellaceae bacterium]|nr:glycosyltransferase [Jiangellaceae bacterium]